MMLAIALTLSLTQAPRGSFELTAYPVVPQLNVLDSEHVGTMGQVGWRLQERFAFVVFGGRNWSSSDSKLNDELIVKSRVEVQGSRSTLWTWAVFGGVELAPVTTELHLSEGVRTTIDVVVSMGAGVGGTRHSLRPLTISASAPLAPPEPIPARYGDTGTRFMSTFGLGARVGLGEHLALRLELRDVMYSARVDQVFGCTESDLNPFKEHGPGTSCDFSRFEEPRDTVVAWGTIRTSSSQVVHSLGLWAGASFGF